MSMDARRNIENFSKGEPRQGYDQNLIEEPSPRDQEDLARTVLNLCLMLDHIEE